MILNFNNFINEYANAPSDCYSGPSIVPKGAISIANKKTGGSSDGSIGGEFDSESQPTATPPKGGWKYQVDKVERAKNKIKNPADIRKLKALKKLGKLNKSILSFDQFKKK